MTDLTPPTAWDIRGAIRGAVLTAFGVVLAVVVTGATDEGGIGWPERVARVAPLIPVLGALGTGLALRGRDRRGEGRALEALGRAPVATGVGAALGAACIGLVVALALLVSTQLSVDGFFPTVHAAGVYTFDAGVFHNARTGWGVTRDGSIVFASSPVIAQLSAAAREGEGHAYARLAAALITATASLGFSLTVALVPRGGRRGPHGPYAWATPRVRAGLVLALVAAASALGLQAAAASRVPALLVITPSTLLLLGAAWAIVREVWPEKTRTQTDART